MDDDKEILNEALDDFKKDLKEATKANDWSDIYPSDMIMEAICRVVAKRMIEKVIN